MKKLLFTLSLFLITHNAQAENIIPVTDIPFTPLPLYEETQKPRQGQYTFLKDPNIWVYSKEFAERFGIPTKWVDKNLQGAEAIAFRIEQDAHEICGYGGDINSCHRPVNCMFDIYLKDADGKKLPWVNHKTSDWRTTESNGFLSARSEDDYWHYYDEINHKKYVVRGDIGLNRIALVYDDPSDYWNNVANLTATSFKRDFYKDLDMISVEGCDALRTAKDHADYQIYFPDPSPDARDEKYQSKSNLRKDIIASGKLYYRDRDAWIQRFEEGKIPHKIKLPEDFMEQVFQRHQNDKTNDNLIDKVKKIVGSN